MEKQNYRMNCIISELYYLIQNWFFRVAAGLYFSVQEIMFHIYSQKIVIRDSLKTLRLAMGIEPSTLDYPSSSLCSQPQPQWRKHALLRSLGDCEVAGDWHLKKVEFFFKGSEWSDRKEEGKWKEERRKTGQCHFIKLFFPAS